MTMLVEYAESPLAIATRKPRFSWEVPFEGQDRMQSAYQILVATEKGLLEPGKADLWDSGKVTSSQSVNVEYVGAELQSNMDCFWTVQVWDESDVAGETSGPEYFGTGLFQQDDWAAKWIGMGDPDEPYSDPTLFQRDLVKPEVKEFEPDPRAPMLRKEFAVTKPVKRARAFVAGVGLFEFRLNGNKPGIDVLSTPRTSYNDTVYYTTYDITDKLSEGDNALGLMLGNGWYNGKKKYWGWQQQWHGSPRGIAQIEVEYEDGSSEQIMTDGSWQGSWSPITANCIYDGEHYDARLEQPGWDTTGFDSSEWKSVNLVASPGCKLLPLLHEEEKVTETIRPDSMTEPEPGVFVFDMGKNITGWVRLNIKDGKAGDQVNLHFGEAQHEDGALNASSNNAAEQRDEYICRGGDETYEPRFTFHGFQFVEIRGYPGTPDLDSVTGCFVRTAVAQTGSFECGNEMINNIHQCTLQSQLCNVQLGVPTDDTQRPERLGWGADAWATAIEALYNLWMPRVYAKWTGDFRDQQAECGMVGMIAPQPGAEEDLPWTACFVLIPWWQYLHCGDRRILKENYPALRRYMEYLARVGVKDVETVPSGELISRLLWRSGLENRFPAEEDRGMLQISQWGDHLATAEGSASRSNLPLSMATAFCYLDVTTMARIARALGKDDDASGYEKLAAEIKEVFNARFYDSNVGYYDTGVQSAQAWPLVFGLVPDEEIERVTNYLIRSVSQVQRRLTTGYTSTKFAIQALSNAGRDDLVWERATSMEYPSWGYMLRNNRTTSCERWDGDGGSLNHAPLGAAIDEWFYSDLLGIRPDENAPGFEKVIIRPYVPKDLPWAKGSLRTARGLIVSEWKHDGETATLNITVPANCTAEVHVPTDDVAVEVGSGSHSFEWSLTD